MGKLKVVVDRVLCEGIGPCAEETKYIELDRRHKAVILEPGKDKEKLFEEVAEKKKQEVILDLTIDEEDEIFRATTGGNPEINLRAIFGRNITIHGVYMGTKGEVSHYLKFFPENLKPVIDTIYSFKNIKEAYRKLLSRQFFGKIVVSIP